MRRWKSVGCGAGALLLALASAGACTKAPAPTRAEVPVATETDASTAEPAPNGSASPPPDAAPPPDSAASDGGSALGSDPKRFACENTTCQAGRETCCRSDQDGICFASTPDDGPQGSIGYLKTQFEVCSKAPYPGGYSMAGIDRCDESIDCKDSELCCSQFLFSGATMGECVAKLKTGGTPCDFGERCYESSTCRLPGTECTRGFCRKRAVVRCDQGTCPPGTVCCGEPAGCQAPEACDPGASIHCSHDRDCLAGERCIVMGKQAECRAVIQDPFSQQTLCRKSSDCRLTCPKDSPGKVRCLPSSIPWLKTCQCP